MTEYGADPTGQVDSTEAIITALKTPRTVTFPPGMYKFDGGRNVTIGWAGKQVSGYGATIVLTPSVNSKPPISVTADNVTIAGLTMIGNRKNSKPNNGIEVRGCDGFVGRDLHLSKFLDGLYVGSSGKKGCTNITLDRVTCLDNSRNGMSIVHCDGGVIRDCNCSDTMNIQLNEPGYGIDVEPNVGTVCHNLQFINCEAHRNYRTGFVCTGQSGLIEHIQWIDGKTHDNHQDGIRLYNAHNVFLSGQARGNVRDGVRIEGGSTSVTCNVDADKITL